MVEIVLFKSSFKPAFCPIVTQSPHNLHILGECTEAFLHFETCTLNEVKKNSFNSFLTPFFKALKRFLDFEPEIAVLYIKIATLVLQFDLRTTHGR